MGKRREVRTLAGNVLQNCCIRKTSQNICFVSKLVFVCFGRDLNTLLILTDSLRRQGQPCGYVCQPILYSYTLPPNSFGFIHRFSDIYGSSIPRGRGTSGVPLLVDIREVNMLQCSSVSLQCQGTRAWTDNQFP